MLPTKFEVWTTYVTFSLHMTHITNFPHIILNYNNNHNYIVYTLVSLITVLTCKFQSQYCFWSVLFLVRGRGLLELVCCAALWVVAGEDTHIQHSPQMSGAWKEGGGVVVSIQWLVPIRDIYTYFHRNYWKKIAQNDRSHAMDISRITKVILKKSKKLPP